MRNSYFSLTGMMVAAFAAVAASSLLPYESARLSGVFFWAPLLISAGPGMLALMGRARLRRSEWHFGLLLLLYLLGNLVSYLFAREPSGAVVDLGRQSLIVCWAFLFALTLRRHDLRAHLARLMVFPAALGLLSIVATYVSVMGFAPPSPGSLEAFKSAVSERFSVNMNSTGSAAVICCMMCWPAWAVSRWARYAGSLVILVTGYVSGSRTAFGAMVAALALASVFGRFRSDSRRLPSAVLAAVMVILIAAILIPSSYMSRAVDPTVLSSVTTARYDLWVMGMRCGLRSPVVGAGAESWRDELAVAELPGYATYDESVLDLKGGAYHNIYITVFAEKGLVTLVPALFLLCWLWSRSWQVWSCRGELTGMDARFAAAAPYVMTFLVVRQFFEASGLFGYGNGGLDLLAYGVACWIAGLHGYIESRIAGCGSLTATNILGARSAA